MISFLLMLISSFLSSFLMTVAPAVNQPGNVSQITCVDQFPGTAYGQAMKWDCLPTNPYKPYPQDGGPPLRPYGKCPERC